MHMKPHKNSVIRIGDACLYQTTKGRYQAAFITNVANSGMVRQPGQGDDDGRRSPQQPVVRLDPTTNLPFTDERGFTDHRLDPNTNQPLVGQRLDPNGLVDRRLDPNTNTNPSVAGQRLDPNTNQPLVDQTPDGIVGDRLDLISADNQLGADGRRIDPNTNLPYTDQVHSLADEHLDMDMDGRLDPSTNMPYADRGQNALRRLDAGAEIVDLCMLEPTGVWRPVTAVKRGTEVAQWCLATDAKYDEPSEIDPVNGLPIGSRRALHDDGRGNRYPHQMEADRLNRDGQRFDAAGPRTDQRIDPNTNLPTDLVGLPVNEVDRQVEADRQRKLASAERKR